MVVGGKAERSFRESFQETWEDLKKTWEGLKEVWGSWILKLFRSFGSEETSQVVPATAETLR
jgi:hypothetical protein